MILMKTGGLCEKEILDALKMKKVTRFRWYNYRIHIVLFEKY